MNALTRRQGGIALLMVLWVLVMFSAVAVSYAYGLRAEARMTRNQLERARAEALAEAGVARALQVITAERDLEPRYGLPERVRLDGGDVVWSVQNAAGLLNLNTASSGQLSALLRRFGVPSVRATALGDAVADWRDADDLRRLDGAEDRDYLAAELAYGAADALFQHRAELQQVLGMDPVLYALLEPHVTVYGNHQGINLKYASRDLLVRIGAGTAEEIDAYLQLRVASPLLAQPPLPAELATSGMTGSARSRFVVVRAEGRTAGGARAAIEAVADLDSVGDGIRLVDWRPVPSGPAEEVRDAG
ncbi:MAG: type II secretion system protein GspK [Gammaproteobacteria bacterium]|nr:type II secretion system protein GspK [Gammaproteobacteria bacterium]